MSRISDPVDTALESLRVHGTSHRDSLFQDLENQMVEVERQRAAQRNMLAKVLIVTGILVGGGVAGYAAVNPSIWKGFSFFVEEDGTVTDEDGEVSGDSIKNDNDTFTTTVDFGNGTGIVTTSDKPLTEIHIGPTGDTENSEGKVFIFTEPNDQK